MIVISPFFSFLGLRVSLVCSASVSCFFFLGLLQAQDDTEEEVEGLEALTQEQSETLEQKVQEIEDAFAAQRDARHAAVFRRFEEVIDDDLMLYNFYIECVEVLEYSDENEQRGDRRASKEFEQWRRKLDEDVDRAEFANMLRAQIKWLRLIKRAEVLTQNYGNEDGMIEQELAPEALALFEEILESGEELGKHFRDLGQPVLSSPLAKATGLNDGVYQPKLIPQAPLQIQNLYRKLYIEPGIKNQDIPLLLAGYDKFLASSKEMMRIEFEIKKRALRDRGREGAQESRRMGNFEDSVAMKGYLEGRLPQHLWQREVDRFKAGGEVDGARNMYQLILEYPDHYSRYIWIRDLRNLLKRAEQKRKQEEEARKAQEQSA